MISPVVGDVTIAPASSASSGASSSGQKFGSYGNGVSTSSLGVVAVAVVLGLFLLKGRK